MTQRQEEIIKKSIVLFNENGAGNVKLADITLALDISLGNLTYYYKTKKDLLNGILDFMLSDSESLKIQSEQFLAENDWLSLIENYLLFQVKYCFFYRDILDLLALDDRVRSLYETEVCKVITFIKSSIQMSISKGYLHPEPRKGIYDGIAENEWSIIQTWFITRAVFGEQKVPLDGVVRKIMDMYYPYTTKEGLVVVADLYAQKKKALDHQE